MKKSLILIIILFSITSFLGIRTKNNTQLWSNLLQPIDGEVYYFNLSNEKEDALEIFECFIQSADKYSVSITIDRGDSKDGIYTTYYYSPTSITPSHSNSITNKLDKPLYQINTEIDFSKYDAPTVYTTNRNELANGYYFVYYPEEFQTYQLKNFYDFSQNNVRINGTITLFGDMISIEKFVGSINENFGEASLTKQEVIYSDAEQYSTNKLPLYMSFVLLLILILQEISSSGKQIGLMKSLGFSNYKIFRELFRTNLVLGLLINIVSYMMLYIILISQYNIYILPLIKDLLTFIILMLLFHFIAILVCYLGMCLIPTVVLLKNQSLNHLIHIFSFVMKTSLILLLLPTVLAQTTLFLDTIRVKIQLEDYKVFSENMTSYTSKYSIQDSKNPEALPQQLYEAYEQLLSYKHTYLYTLYDVGIESNLDEFQTIVEVDYEYYQNYLISKLKVPLNPKQTSILMINSSYEQFNPYTNCQDCNIIITHKNFSVENLGFLPEPHIKNPILVVKPEILLDRSEVTQTRIINLAEDKNHAKEIQEVMNQKYKHRFTFGSYSEELRIALLNNTVKLRENGLATLESLFTLFMIFYLGNYTLYKSREKEFSIRTTLGQRFIRIFFIFILNDSLTFMLSIYVLITANVPIKTVLYFTTFIFIIDILIIYILLRKESPNIMKSIKNG